MNIKLIVSENKKLELKKNVNVYVGENKINRFKVVLPDSGKFCGYNLADCQVELREVLPDNTYVSEIIDQNNPYVYITFDITSEPQTINLLFVVTKDGNVIGETNTEELRVQQNKDGGTPIDPREELDQIIAELRAEKVELLRIISDLEAQLDTARLVNIDLTVDSLNFFDSLPSDIEVSGRVYVDGIILLSDKQRLETKYPELIVTAEYIIDFENYMIAITGGVVVDSDDNVLAFNSGGAYQSKYSASDIDDFIVAVNEAVNG